MTLKEQLQRQKEIKNKIIMERSERQRQEKIKRNHNSALKNDFIPFYEWQGSTYIVYLELMRSKLSNNSHTINDLLQHYIQLHRFTFWECDYNFSNIRLIIEELFNKYLGDITEEQLKLIIDSPISIHYKQRNLLMQFLEIVVKYVFNFNSRTKFAIANNDMITCHNAYCNMVKPILMKYASLEGIKEAQLLLRKKLASKEIYLAEKQNKVIIYTETGDIEIN